MICNCMLASMGEWHQLRGFPPISSCGDPPCPQLRIRLKHSCGARWGAPRLPVWAQSLQQLEAYALSSYRPSMQQVIGHWQQHVVCNHPGRLVTAIFATRILDLKAGGCSPVLRLLRFWHSREDIPAQYEILFRSLYDTLPDTLPGQVRLQQLACQLSGVQDPSCCANSVLISELIKTAPFEELLVLALGAIPRIAVVEVRITWAI